MTVHTGLEHLLSSPQAWLDVGERVGLLTNPTSVDRAFQSSIDLMSIHQDINLTRLYGPEHGIRGDGQAGVEVDNATDERTGLPVSSLYRHGGAVDAAIFDEIDVLVIDLQDVGARFYTYPATADHAAATASEAGVRVLVLDRPNPIAWMGVFGNRVEAEYASLVGMQGLPVNHGCTIGEVLRFTARQAGRALPQLVQVDGWHRSMQWHETGLPWIPPSPNLPTLDSAHLYPATCWIEGTNLSEGRGTTLPFEVLGAPWIDGDELASALSALKITGYAFRPISFTPMFSKHVGERCGGVQIHPYLRHDTSILSRGPQLLSVAHKLSGANFEWISNNGRQFIDLLAGSQSLRRWVDNNEDIDRLFDAWAPATRGFENSISPDLAYGPISGQ